MSKDRFDKAVDYLTEHPDLIAETWNAALDDYTDDLSSEEQEAHEIAACLFLECGNKGFPATGCLTQVCHERLGAGTDELTELIRADKKIPRNGEAIKVGDLQLFADWQRRIKRELAAARKAAKK